MNTTQTKVRQVSLNLDVLRMKAPSVDQATETFLKYVNEVSLKLASEGKQVSGVRILEAQIEKDMVHFKFDDPDNLIDIVSLHMNESNPNAKIEVHHTSARS